MISKAEYQAMDGTEIAEKIRSGEVHKAEILQCALTIAQEVGPKLNCFVEIFDAPLDASKEGAFAGVPFVIKDIFNTAKGVGLENGSRMSKGLVADSDSALMDRFRRAGLHAIGRTATPEFGFSSTTESIANGPTRNPWKLDHMPGGSSGGSSAAVASGIVPFGHASDGGGSIRIPAACCGLVGLKPTRGRVTQAPGNGIALNGLAAEFAVTRSIRDTARLLDAVSTPEPGEPVPILPFSGSCVQAIEVAPKGLRIAVMTDSWSDVPVDKEMVDAVNNTAQLCESLGHHVEFDRPELDNEVFMTANDCFWMANLYHWIVGLEAAGMPKASRETLEATTWESYKFGGQLSADDILTAYDFMNTMSRDFAKFFQNYDLLLTPTVAQPSLPLGSLNADAPGVSAQEWTQQVFGFAPFTAQFNMTGQPAISLPLHRRPLDGLPCGVQFVADSGQEQLLLRLAAQLERAAPWPKVAPLHTLS